MRRDDKVMTSSSPLLQAADDGPKSLGHKNDGPIPLYWILVISLYNIPLGLMNICIGQILLPPLIKATVGNDHKESALGQVASLCSLIHSVEPFLGAISDRARCSFRKRAFIIFGQAFTCMGIAGFWYVSHIKEWRLLVIACECSHRTCQQCLEAAQ